MSEQTTPLEAGDAILLESVENVLCVSMFRLGMTKQEAIDRFNRISEEDKVILARDFFDIVTNHLEKPEVVSND